MRVLLFAILLFVLIHWMDIVALVPADLQRAFGLALVLVAIFGGSGSFSDK